jgi:hypothetical protein
MPKGLAMLDELVKVCVVQGIDIGGLDPPEPFGTGRAVDDRVAADRVPLARLRSHTQSRVSTASFASCIPAPVILR